MATREELRKQAWRCLDAAEKATDPELKSKFSEKAVELAQLAVTGSNPIPTGGQIQDPYSGQYRMYFLHLDRVLASFDLDAEGEDVAMVLAEALHDACSDVCEDFELWCGLDRIIGNAAERRWTWPKGWEEISAANQECLLDREEALLSSRQAVARSRKLLDATARLRRDLASRSEDVGRHERT